MFDETDVRADYWETLEILTARIRQLERFRQSLEDYGSQTRRGVNLILRRGRNPTKAELRAAHREALADLPPPPPRIRRPPHRWTAAEAAEAGRRGRGKTKTRWRKAQPRIPAACP